MTYFEVSNKKKLNGLLFGPWACLFLENLENVLTLSVTWWREGSQESKEPATPPSAATPPSVATPPSDQSSFPVWGRESTHQYLYSMHAWIWLNGKGYRAVFTGTCLQMYVCVYVCVFVRVCMCAHCQCVDGCWNSLYFWNVGANVGPFSTVLYGGGCCLLKKVCRTVV